MLVCSKNRAGVKVRSSGALERILIKVLATQTEKVNNNTSPPMQVIAGQCALTEGTLLGWLTALVIDIP